MNAITPFSANAAIAAAQHVASAATGDDVIAIAALDDVDAVGAFEHVGTGGSGDRRLEPLAQLIDGHDAQCRRRGQCQRTVAVHGIGAGWPLIDGDQGNQALRSTASTPLTKGALALVPEKHPGNPLTGRQLGPIRSGFMRSSRVGPCEL